MNALLWWVAPIVALKFNVKVDWSSLNVSQNFNLLIKQGFSCINVRQVYEEMFKTEGDRSGGYRGENDHSIVHGRGVEACCHAFPVPEPVPEPGLG